MTTTTTKRTFNKSEYGSLEVVEGDQRVAYISKRSEGYEVAVAGLSHYRHQRFHTLKESKAFALSMDLAALQEEDRKASVERIEGFVSRKISDVQSAVSNVMALINKLPKERREEWIRTMLDRAATQTTPSQSSDLALEMNSNRIPLTQNPHHGFYGVFTNRSTDDPNIPSADQAWYNVMKAYGDFGKYDLRICLDGTAGRHLAWAIMDRLEAGETDVWTIDRKEVEDTVARWRRESQLD